MDSSRKIVTIHTKWQSKAAVRKECWTHQHWLTDINRCNLPVTHHPTPVLYHHVTIVVENLRCVRYEDSIGSAEILTNSHLANQTLDRMHKLSWDDKYKKAQGDTVRLHQSICYLHRLNQIQLNWTESASWMNSLSNSESVLEELSLHTAQQQNPKVIGITVEPYAMQNLKTENSQKEEKSWNIKTYGHIMNLWHQ